MICAIGLPSRVSAWHAKTNFWLFLSRGGAPRLADLTRLGQDAVGVAGDSAASEGLDFKLSRPFLSHASPRHPAGRPASLFMTVRHGTRYAAMSYVGPVRVKSTETQGSA